MVLEGEHQTSFIFKRATANNFSQIANKYTEYTLLKDIVRLLENKSQKYTSHRILLIFPSRKISWNVDEACTKIDV